MPQTDDDLVPLAAAAVMADRSVRTLRAWIKAGNLTRQEGPLPATGGSAPVLVSKAELMIWLAASGIQPRVASGGSDQVDAPPVESIPMFSAATSSVQPAGNRAEVLQVKLEAVESLAAERERRIVMEGQLTTTVTKLEAQKIAADERANALGLELDRTRSDLAGSRSDVTEWKERYDALAAELAATRALLQREQGMTVWQRLITGPTKPALPES